MEVAARALRLTALLSLAAAAAVIGWRTVTAALRLGDDACRHPVESLPGGLIVLLGLAAFGAGHLTARYRAARTAPAGPARARGTDIVVHLLLSGFFLAVLVLLAYETVALLGWDGLQPITAYVRCARALDPATTTAATLAICFLTGHWLWYPDQMPARRS